MRPITAPVSTVSPASTAAIFGGTGGPLDPGSDGVLADELDDKMSVAAMNVPPCGLGRTALREPAVASLMGGFVHAHVFNEPEACRWILIDVADAPRAALSAAPAQRPNCINAAGTGSPSHKLPPT